MSAPEEAARAVLHFWFDELSEEQHWRKEPAMDREIAKRFGAVREAVLKSKAKGWRDTPETLLAAIILLDQFSRNIFRGTARAFEGDKLALELSKQAMERGWVEEAPKLRKAFFLLPLMHSEKRPTKSAASPSSSGWAATTSNSPSSTTTRLGASAASPVAIARSAGSRRPRSAT